MRAEYWKYYPHSRIAYFRSVHCSNAEFRNTVHILEIRFLLKHGPYSAIRSVFQKYVFQKCVFLTNAYFRNAYLRDTYFRNTVRILEIRFVFLKNTIRISEVPFVFQKYCQYFRNACFRIVYVRNVYFRNTHSSNTVRVLEIWPVFSLRNTVCVIEMRILGMRSVFQKYDLYFRNADRN